MMIALHDYARTTPVIRAVLASDSHRAAALAQRLGITDATLYKWKKCTSVHDTSLPPQRLQTALTPAKERVVVDLRRTLLLPFDKLQEIAPKFFCPQARSTGLTTACAATAWAT